MGKNIYFFGNPVFGQLINLIPEHLIKDLVSNNNSDYYYKRFKTYDHLVVMLYACLHQCESLRVLVTGIQAHQQKLRHLGLKDISTISDANRLRDSIIFEQLFHKLVNLFMGNLSDSRFTAKDKIHHRIYCGFNNCEIIFGYYERAGQFNRVFTFQKVRIVIIDFKVMRLIILLIKVQGFKMMS